MVAGNFAYVLHRDSVTVKAEYACITSWQQIISINKRFQNKTKLIVVCVIQVNLDLYAFISAKNKNIRTIKTLCMLQPS